MSDKVEIIIQARDKFSGVFGSVREQLPGLKTSFLALAGGITAAGAAVLALAKQTAEANDKIQKLSDQTGQSTRFLSRMAAASEFSGVKFETTAKAVEKIAIQMVEAEAGNIKAAAAFARLGIETRDADGQLRSVDQILPQMANGFAGMENATERSAVAAALLGEEGAQLQRLFVGGAAGLAAMMAEADRFGTVVGENAGQSAALFNDSLTRMQMAFAGVRNTIAERLMPTLSGFFNNFAYWIADNREKIADWARVGVEMMAKLAEYGAYAGALLVDSWRGLQMVWQVLRLGFAALVEAVVTGIDWLIEKTRDMMAALNFRGMFDEALAGVDRFRGDASAAIEDMRRLGDTAYTELDRLANQGLAVERVGAFVDQAKGWLADLQLAAQPQLEMDEEQRGIYPFTGEEIARSQENAASYLEWLEAFKEEQAEKQERAKQKDAKAEAVDTKKRQDDQKKALADMHTHMQAFGEKGFQLAKGIQAAQAVMDTHEAAIAAYKAMAGIPIIGPALGVAAAAAAIAYGTARVAAIKSAEYGGAAHGGLGYVPREQTYLLDRGERVLSPRQNRDLTDYLEGGAGGGAISVAHQEVHVHVEIPTLGVLLSMGRHDWRSLAEEKIVPALRNLKAAGVAP